MSCNKFVSLVVVLPKSEEVPPLDSFGVIFVLTVGLLVIPCLIKLVTTLSAKFIIRLSDQAIVLHEPVLVSIVVICSSIHGVI